MTVSSDHSAYVIDGNDRLVHVNAAWKDFAKENGSPAMASDLILGRRLWDFVAGQEVAHLYQALFRRVRESGTSVTVPFRCDAPDRRRDMRLEMHSSGNELHLTALLDQEETRQPIELAGGTWGGGEVLYMCSWCKRLDLGEWIELDEAVASHGVLTHATLPPISHGICPSCEHAMLQMT